MFIGRSTPVPSAASHATTEWGTTTRTFAHAAKFTKTVSALALAPKFVPVMVNAPPAVPAMVMLLIVGPTNAKLGHEK